MSKGIRELIAGWDGVGVVCRYDRPTGTWIFVCIHNDSLGPATGGSRMKVYPELGEALEDAMRLAEGMTYKWAGIGVKNGGGKAVLAIPAPLEGEARTGLLHRYGELLESLRGTFRTGEDLGTTTEDMQTVSERTGYIQGFHPTTGEKINPSPFTAEAVYKALLAALGAVFDSDSPAGRSVLVQGVGNVGERLARRLAAGGARLLVNDIDAARAAALAEELGGEAVEDAELYGTACDVYAPCAVGATLNSETIPRLACKIVCGSANNQLATENDAELLHQRGIVYTPDYVSNAGGALSFSLIEQGIIDENELLERMSTVGNLVSEILAEASREHESPVATARRRVERLLSPALEPA